MAVVLHCAARGHAFDIRLDDDAPPVILDSLRSLESSLELTPVTRPLWCLERSTENQRMWRVQRDGVTLIATPRIGEALSGLMHFLSRSVSAEGEGLSVHAAAVSLRGRGICMPAPSGAGKSSMCARLMQQGCAYLTDESVGVAPTGRLLGYAKPVALKSRAVPYVADLGLADLEVDFDGQSVWHVPPARFGAGVEANAEPALLVLPRFVDGADATLEPVNRARMAFEVLAHAQNIDRVGVLRAVECAGNLVARSIGYQLDFGDAGVAASVLVDRLASLPAVAPTAWTLVPPRPSRSSPETPKPAHDVTAACYPDGALLVRAGSGQMLVTDAIGAAVWQRLGHADRASMVDDLAIQFGAPPQRIETDVAAWFDELAAMEFVTRGGEP